MLALNFRILGEPHPDLPPILVIHGLFGSLENLAGVARPLAESRNVYSIDLPNHSRSPHTETTSLVQMAEEVLAWMDSQGLAKIDLVGHSLGGKVAMEIALQHPERVNRLVVMDIAPVKYPPHHNQVFAGLQSLDTQSLSSRSAADAHMLQYVPELAVRSFLLKNLIKSGDGFAWRFNLPVVARDYPELIAGNSAGVFEGPVMFLKGGDSDYITEVHREPILTRFPSASVKVVEKTGHWLHADKPVVVAKLIKNFLDKE